MGRQRALSPVIRRMAGIITSTWMERDPCAFPCGWLRREMHRMGSGDRRTVFHHSMIPAFQCSQFRGSPYAIGQVPNQNAKI